MEYNDVNYQMLLHMISSVVVNILVDNCKMTTQKRTNEHSLESCSFYVVCCFFSFWNIHKFVPCFSANMYIILEIFTGVSFGKTCSNKESP